jgi:hypothetical protein
MMKRKLTRGTDRRKNSAGRICEIPLIDQKGDVIAEDRRTLPDRRLNNISVEELECSEYIQAIVKQEEE